ncbi:PucR family transcriptional regulator [Streptomyces celluloflavus]|uniref:PucR family transcriptional regulator n=1 Tax=Streptomyces celluloflavus TaxID=58344 RepID=UPI0036A3DA91
MTSDSAAMSTLCDAVALRLERADPDLTARIRAELPSYEHLPELEHRRTVRDLVRRMLSSIASGRGPIAEHLQFTRRSALRRTQLGVSAYDVLSSFHIVRRELWAAMQSAPEATDDLLLGLVEPIGRWTETMSASVVDAFVAESPGTAVQHAELRQRFLSELGDRSLGEQVAETARALAFDVEGRFQAFCAPRASWPRPEVENLQRATRRLSGVMQCGVRGDVMIAIAQDCDPVLVVRTVHGIAGDRSAVGIGLPRQGLIGAHLSTIDAERALRTAQLWNEPSVRFADSWLEATLLDSQPRLVPILAGIQQAQRDHPDLAAAVLAFADCGFSLSDAARRLNVHPNTMGYRLSRWQELTGADPRTFAGLARSVIGCRSTPR